MLRLRRFSATVLAIGVVAACGSRHRSTEYVSIEAVGALSGPEVPGFDAARVTSVHVIPCPAVRDPRWIDTPCANCADGDIRAAQAADRVSDPATYTLSLIHISEPTRLLSSSYAVF